MLPYFHGEIKVFIWAVVKFTVCSKQINAILIIQFLIAEGIIVAVQ